MFNNPEFEVDDVVTVDRYNHIDDVQKGVIVGYGEMQLSKTLTYKIRIDGITIESTGVSIMESKLYEPCKDEERHDKLPRKRL